MEETLEIELYFLFMIESMCDLFEEKIEFLNTNNPKLFHVVGKNEIRNFYQFFISNAHQINIKK